MGARSDKPHIAAKHVEQLRQLIEAGPPKERTKWKYAWIVLGCQDQPIRLRRGGVHRPEFEDDEFVAVIPLSFLPEEDRSGAGQPNRHRDGKESRQTENEQEKGKYPILH